MAKREIRIKTVEEGIDGAPSWIATFVDMTSLLVTFFILLFTFSSIRDYDAFAFPGNLMGFSGVMDSDPGDTITSPESDIMSSYDVMRGARIPHSRPLDALLENLEEMGQRDDEQHQVLDLRRLGVGLRISFAEDACFSPGSSEASAGLRKALAELARTLSSYSFMVSVEGFVDDAFRPTPRYPHARDLALGRAESAAQVLVEAGFQPMRLLLAGLEPTVAEGAEALSPQQRKRQRRVEVRILPQRGPDPEELER